MKNNNQTRRCPACGNRQHDIIKPIDLLIPQRLALQGKFNVVACHSCGMVFHDVVHQESRETYYNSYTGEISAYPPPAPEQNALNQMTLEFIRSNLVIGPKAEILDIGCSFGITLLALREAGFQKLHAVDPDHAAIAYLRSMGISAKIGLATEHFGEFNKKFDLIIIRHVLEHLYDPLLAINNARQWLKPGGHIYIELPDLEIYPETSLFPGYFCEFEHINHFSKNSLMNLMHNFNLIAHESTGEIYPCIRALFAPSEESHGIKFTPHDAQHMLSSLTIPNIRGQTVLNKIQDLAGTPLALWGVSIMAWRILSHTPLKNCNIQHLVDRNIDLHSDHILGIPISPPEILGRFSGTIVLCGENSAEAIERSIRKIGMNNKIVRLLQ